MELHNEEFVSASKRASDRLRKAPIATAVRYDRRIGRLVIELSSGIEVAFRPHDAQGLEKAKVADLDDIEISPSGLGIHFPRLDADLYLPALLEGFFGSRQWIAAQNGRAGGKATSPTKADAARQNGKLGGRPRKSPSQSE
ncbi:MAG: DUF2442 domain-containing protein [Rhodocyclaceae bacterium]|nr:DUF2442 domain-containing protein [Rhodocyclaceae bacterium]